MSTITSRSVGAKRRFYDQPEIARGYEEQRFGGASGAWVNAREIELALDLLPASSKVLDLGCGTGRLTRALARRGRAVGVDAASAMLAEAKGEAGLPFVQGDAFALPFAEGAFDAAVALRVAFHFRRLDSLLKGMRQVVRPGGRVVFDTYLWSPRALLPLDPARWGGGVFIHNPTEIKQAAEDLGLAIEAAVPAFLFSPYVYRRLPLAMVRALERVESVLPAAAHARLFWKLTRVE